MIPEGWQEAKLQDVAPVIDCKHKTPRYTAQGVPIVSPGNLAWGALKLDGCRTISESDHAEMMDHCSVAIGDVVFGRNQSVGVSSIVTTDSPFALGQDTVLIKPTSISPGFLHQWLQSRQFELSILRLQGGSTFGRINLKDLRAVPTPVPPSNEADRIAKTLHTWDLAIETVEALIANARAQKQALMQQLLPQGTTPSKKRLHGFSGEWREVRLGNLVKEVNRDVDWDDEATYKLISVRRRSEGIFHRESLLGHEILTKAMKVALAGDFLISKMQIVHGASALVKADFDGFNISGSYIALVAKDQAKLDIEYFNWYSRTPYFYKLAYISSYGVHIEKMTFNLKSFLKKTILIPPSKVEQSAIVEQLNSAEALIGSYQSQADALRQEKAALMQQLLTGKRRVKLPESELA